MFIHLNLKQPKEAPTLQMKELRYREVPTLVEWQSHDLNTGPWETNTHTFNH